MKLAIVLLAASALACAQPEMDQQAPPPAAQVQGPAQPQGPPQPPPPPAVPGAAAPGPRAFRLQPAAPPVPRPARPPLERALGPGGRWWSNPQMAQKIGLTADQQKRMDDIFQQNRLRLIDLNASLQKEEAIMEPLVSADQPDETKILAQIDKVAQARAELEKANARMLLDIRRVLTADQWKKLQAEAPPPAAGAGPRPRLGGEPAPGR